jgi:hypothetical protein
MKPPTFITLALVFGTALSACQDEPPKDENKLIEYVEVAGLCRENHVIRSAEYKGSLVHWFNVTKGKHDVYGSVHYAKNVAAKTLEANPYKYHPPFSVKFSDLTPEQVAQPKFPLFGISCGSGDHVCEKPRYETTCRLRVVQRLDHLPKDIYGDQPSQKDSPR